MRTPTYVALLGLTLLSFACDERAAPAPETAPSAAASATPSAALGSSPDVSAPSGSAAPSAAAAEDSAPDGGAAAASPISDTLETSEGPLTITPIHHGTVAFGFKGKTIVVDPYSAAPKGSLPKADLVLITDIHPDHLDAKALAEVTGSDTQVVASTLAAERVTGATPLANGQETTQGGLRIRAVPAYNLKRGPEPGKLYHDKGRGNGYLISFADKLVYVSGDTECVPEMKELKDVDVAFISMNLPYTMPPEEALECAKAFKPKVLIPYHYRGSDLAPLVDGLKDTGVELRQRDFYTGK